MATIKQKDINLSVIVSEELTNKRLDQVLAALLPAYSRTLLQQWIKSSQVTIAGKTLKPRDKVFANQTIVINATIEPQERWQPQPIALDIIYEDDDIIVINKPAGLVVHPAAGNADGTMLNALLNHDSELNNLPRAGIIHRLDKNTSGLLVVTRSLHAHTKLVADLQAREIKREYEAIVNGVMTAGGTINAPIGRHPKDRKRMAVVPSGKPAITHYRVLKRFQAHTHIKVMLETGRTHQIRVHMAYIHYPIVGDPIYGGRLKLAKGMSSELKEYLQHFHRQALHAKCLGLHHPTTGEYMQWEAPLPQDMTKLLELFNPPPAPP